MYGFLSVQRYAPFLLPTDGRFLVNSLRESMTDNFFASVFLGHLLTRGEAFWDKRLTTAGRKPVSTNHAVQAAATQI